MSSSDSVLPRVPALSPYSPRSLSAAVDIIDYTSDRTLTYGPDTAAGSPFSALTTAHPDLREGQAIVIPGDLSRVWLAAFANRLDTGVVLRPRGLPVGYGVVSQPGQHHVIIHAATYPGLIALEWVAYPITPGGLVVLGGLSQSRRG